MMIYFVHLQIGDDKMKKIINILVLLSSVGFASEYYSKLNPHKYLTM